MSCPSAAYMRVASLEGVSSAPRGGRPEPLVKASPITTPTPTTVSIAPMTQHTTTARRNGHCQVLLPLITRKITLTESSVCAIFYSLSGIGIPVIEFGPLSGPRWVDFAHVSIIPSLMPSYLGVAAVVVLKGFVQVLGSSEQGGLLAVGQRWSRGGLVA